MLGLNLNLRTPSWLQLFILLNVLHTRGEQIFCRCNTWDCEEKSLQICPTHYQCFVQVTASEDPNEPPDVLYGCLDQTSILCQNPRPQHFQGAWPIVQCCSTDLCNRDIMPTEPPAWHRARNPVGNLDALHKQHMGSTTPDQQQQQPSDPHQQHPYDHQANNTAHPGRHTADADEASSSSSSSSTSFSINALYIAVPVAGAVILVILVVFAVYLLRRQPRGRGREYKYHSAHQLGGGGGGGIVANGEKPPPPRPFEGEPFTAEHNVRLNCAENGELKHNGLQMSAPGRNPNVYTTATSQSNHNAPVQHRNDQINGINCINSVGRLENGGKSLPIMAVEPFNSSRSSDFSPNYPGDRDYTDEYLSQTRDFPMNDNSVDRPYPDGERSSSGSESKLLLKV